MASTPIGFMSCLAIIMVVVMATQMQIKKADAQILGAGVNLVTVSGRLFCSPNGAPCANCTPLVNAIVNLRLSGSTVNISSTITQSDGRFQIQVTDVSTLLSGILSVINTNSSLRVVVSIPVDGCPALATTTGTLVGIPVFHGIINNGTVIQLVVTNGTFILIVA